MLKKEIHEVLKQALYLTLTWLLTPAVLMYFKDLSYFELFFPMFQFGMFFCTVITCTGDHLHFFYSPAKMCNFLRALIYQQHKQNDFRMVSGN